MSASAVAVCTWGIEAQGLSEDTAEALTLARKLAGALGGGLRLVVLGELPDCVRSQAACYGADQIERLVDPALDSFGADTFVEALAQHLDRDPVRAVVFSQTFDARLVAPRLASRLDAGVVMNCMDLSVDGTTIDATVSAYGGDTRAVYRCEAAPTCIFAINANAVEAAALDGDRPALEVRDVDVDLSAVRERIRVLERPESAEGPQLEHAQIIVAGGRGLGEASNFRLVEDLAAALGGMAAASRPIVDDGWATPSQQVGLTGKITKPALYIAAGISGASQHMVGCAAAKTLVAINRDADAAIFRYAHFGIVGNCLEILPELARAVRERGDR